MSDRMEERKKEMQSMSGNYNPRISKNLWMNSRKPKEVESDHRNTYFTVAQKKVDWYQKLNSRTQRERKERSQIQEGILHRDIWKKRTCLGDVVFQVIE